MAYTTSVAGTAITASWANANVRDQGVSVFTDATARTAAVTVPVDGMISNLTTTDRVDVYNGSSWSALVAPSNGVLTTYTPTLTQTGAVTKTVTYASYIRVGRMIIGNVVLTCTGAGTGASSVIIGLPVAALTTPNSIGSGAVFDSSATTHYFGLAALASSVTFALLGGGGVSNFLGSAQFVAALASPDVVHAAFHYEAAADG